MKRLLFGMSLAMFLSLTGCSEPTALDGDSVEIELTKSTTPTTATASEPASVPAPEEAAVEEPASKETAAEQATAKQIELTPKNTSIEFTGNHKGEDPKPRHGSFLRFTGKARVEGGLKSLEVEIETASLKTEIEKLTNHLKNADFFDVRQFPKASFHSTAIKDKGDGTVEITGDLTLLENTQSLTFPATVSTEGELTLKADFVIDRTRWGMNFGLDNVEKEVPMSITVGG